MPGRLLTRPALVLLAASVACVPDSTLLVEPDASPCGTAICPVGCSDGPCERDCDGGACQPEVVATFSDTVVPSGLALVDDQAFVCDNVLLSAIQRVTLSDGRVSILNGIDGSCPDISFDPVSRRLVWFITAARFGEQPLGIWSQPVDATTATMAATATRPVAVKPRQGEILWTGSSGGVPGLFLVRDGVSIPVEGAGGTTLPGALVVGPEGRVFVAWPEVKNISVALDPSGAGARLLVDGKRTDRDPLEPLAMAASGAHLYYGMDGALWRVGVDGKSLPERLVGGQTSIVSIVADDDSVAWIEATSGSLLRLSLTSGRFERLASGLLQPRDLAWNEAHFFWLEPPRRALMRLPRLRVFRGVKGTFVRNPDAAPGLQFACPVATLRRPCFR